MDIYEALRSDHRKVQTLLDRLTQAIDAKDGQRTDEWKSILDELRSELIPHAHAEEAVFYNALRELDESKSLVLHSYGEHAMADTEIRTLNAAKLIDAQLTSVVEKLRNDLLHHIETEETKVFEAARKVLSDEEARQIGEAFVQLKPRYAKTADSMVASDIALIANLLPRRFVESFRKAFGKKDQTAA